MKTNTRPPKEIYDVLHDAEAKGIILPDIVDKWWFLETAINVNPQCRNCVDKKEGLMCDRSNCPVMDLICKDHDELLAH